MHLNLYPSILPDSTWKHGRLGVTYDDSVVRPVWLCDTRLRRHYKLTTSLLRQKSNSRSWTSDFLTRLWLCWTKRPHRILMATAWVLMILESWSVWNHIKIPQQNCHRILGSVLIAVLISLLSRGAIILIYKLGARAFPHPHRLVMSVWWFLLKLFKVSFRISPEVIFVRIPIESTFFVHTSAKIPNCSNMESPSYHWLSWFLMIFGYFWNITKAEALGNSTWMKKPAFKTNRWVPPAESGCTTATLSCSWVVFSSISF